MSLVSAFALVAGTLMACSSTIDSTGTDDTGSLLPPSALNGSTASTPQPETGALCPAAPSGVLVGDYIGDQLPEIVVKDCNGNDVSLDQSCGKRALWLYVVHEWCPHCKKVGALAQALTDSYASKNLAAVQIVVESDTHQTPTQFDCKAWQLKNQLTTDVTLYDPNGSVKQLFDSTFTSLSVFIDAKRVIRGKTHSDSEATIRQGIDESLTPSN